MILVYSSIFAFFLICASNRFSKKELCYIAAFILIVITVLRATDYSDLIRYRDSYNALKDTNFSNMFDDWKSGDLKDLGFYVVAKVFADVGLSADMWILSIGCAFCLISMKYIYESSKDVFLSFVFLIALYLGFTFIVLRQAVAMAFILIAYRAIVKRKLPVFLFFVAIAFCFHSSALVFLPAYWIINMKLGIKQFVLIFISLFVTVLKPDLFRELIESFAWNESLKDYATKENTLSWAGYIIQMAMLIFCYCFRKGIRSENDLAMVDKMINLMVVGLCFQSFTVVIAQAFRISYYYSIFCITALPSVVALQENKKQKEILYAIAVILPILYMIVSGAYSDYTFFWEKSIFLH